MNQEEVWQELLPRLRRYVVMREWNVAFLTAYFGPRPVTIASWLVNARPPKGDCSLALWYLLHEFGFSMPGIDKLDELIRFAGKMFAFGAASPEDILDVFFGLGDAGNKALYQILRGDRRPKSLVDERSAYQSRLMHSIGQVLAIEQEIAGTAGSIRQLLDAV